MEILLIQDYKLTVRVTNTTAYVAADFYENGGMYFECKWFKYIAHNFTIIKVKMHPLGRINQRNIDENPFSDLKIDDIRALCSIHERSLCKKCKKSRKYFCYICYLPVPQLEGKIPKLSLPLKIDIIKHKNEIDGKSTSAHAAILAPDDVTIFTYPSVPDYEKEENVVLVYPSANAKTVKQYFAENSEYLKINDFPFSKVVFIDSTWNQSKGIYKDERIRSLPAVILKNKISQFWRHQKNSPRWYLATIEAIHQLLVEMDFEKKCFAKNNKNNQEQEHCCDDYDISYDGKYDNLLFFFYFMYTKIHDLYEHDSLLSYQRPLD